MNRIKLSSIKIPALIVLTVLSHALFAQNADINQKQSILEWTGKKITGEHNGTISLSKGELLFVDRILTGGFFEIDMNSIICTDIPDKKSNARLVDHLKSDDFFAVRAHPTARLEITNVQHKESINYTITGNLTIKGSTHALTFPASVSITGETITATADITFDRSKYNIKFSSASFFENLGDEMIYDDIALKVELTGIMKGSK
jgi:polyisoprenoid-binding protein YceI